ncbi:MAG: anti-sigma 24 factor [Cycloclasticus sp.]|nr:MAG: anti-sigma 24 factor [Cycloclasticus sp.]
MKNTHEEQLSSLLDNELDYSETSELIKAIESDQGLSNQIDRYALIRDALNEDVVVYQESFLKRVQDALAVEPTVLTPSRRKPENKSYVAVALAASLAIFTVVIFDVGLFTNGQSSLDSVAAIEAEQNTVLAQEELLQDEELVQHDLTPDTQLVGFEK